MVKVTTESICKKKKSNTNICHQMEATSANVCKWTRVEFNKCTSDCILHVCLCVFVLVIAIQAENINLNLNPEDSFSVI